MDDQYGNHKTLTEEWISYRFDIWYKYTWQSILNQSYWKWIYCVCCDPDAKSITDRYFDTINDERLFVMYSGTAQAKNKMKIIARKKDEIINVRLDSDDMYHPHALEELSYAINDDRFNWWQWRNGYGYQYDVPNAVLKIYKPGHGSGPFFAHRNTKKDWIAKGRVRECQHQTVKKYKPQRLSDGRVLVGIHGRGNTGTGFGNNCFKSKVVGEEKLKVLREFKLICV